MSFSLTICHLYPDRMNIYGDRGNIFALKRRLEWRDIEPVIEEVKTGDKLFENKADFYFFGGGQDQAQQFIAKHLKTKADVIQADIENGVVALTVCGGYQLFGRYYQDPTGQKSEGLGIFNCVTEAGQKRKVGNLLIETTPLAGSILDKSASDTPYPLLDKSTSKGPRQYSLKLIGFENHSGNTFLNAGSEPFGKVSQGFGNNGQDQTEGIRYKNAFGTYLHGSLLPKNPLFADYLLEKALQNKYAGFELKPLKNDLELATFIEAQASL